jgi:hypothetical protein
MVEYTCFGNVIAGWKRRCQRFGIRFNRYIHCDPPKGQFAIIMSPIRATFILLLMLGL